MCMKGNVCVYTEVKAWVLVSVCHLYTYVYRHVPEGCGVRGRAGLDAPGQVVPVPVNEGIEGQAVPPAGGEILDVYLRVTGSVEGRDRQRWRVRREKRGGERGREGETHIDE